LRGLLKSIAYRSSYEYDGIFDWVLKKAGKSSEIATLIKEQNDKPPMPKSNGVQMRSSQDRFIEERKESRANLGHLGA